MYKNTKYRKLNSNVNFDREGKKNSARKDPTEVICVKCKEKFILPFRPRDPKVYCNSCFKKKNQ